MRSAISSSARAAMFAQESSCVFPALLEITHGVAAYENPLRVCNNTVDLLFAGETYYAFPFQFNPPDQKEDGSIQNATLTIWAGDQQLASILRSTEVAPTVRAVATFWDDSSGTVVFEEMASWPLTLRNVSGQYPTITADLIYDAHLENEAPAAEFRPALFPGVF